MMISDLFIYDLAAAGVKKGRTLPSGPPKKKRTDLTNIALWQGRDYSQMFGADSWEIAPRLPVLIELWIEWRKARRVTDLQRCNILSNARGNCVGAQK
jgi:hypothetical protein